MPVRVVRLGSPRLPDEGLRLGTVRRPPRGVPKTEFAVRDFYDAWLPELAPSQELVTRALGAKTDAEWSAFVRAYRKEMSTPAARHLLDLVAQLSHTTALTVVATALTRRGVTGRCSASSSPSAAPTWPEVSRGFGKLNDGL